MAYHDDLRADLVRWLGKDKVHFLPGWDRKDRGIGWGAKSGTPVALLCHHTGGAATDSTDPKHKGNRHGANDGQWKYVQDHFHSPAANFTLDRDGCLYVHSAYPVWHSGTGTFKGQPPYDTLGIPDDKGADWMLGVEVVSKGMKKDFTSAQKWALGRLANATKDASGWRGFSKRLPNHRTWDDDSGKVDTRYEESTLRRWAENARAKGPAAR